MWPFYIHVAGKKKVVVVAAAFFSICMACMLLLVLPLPWAVLLVQLLGNGAGGSLGNHLGLVGASAGHPYQAG